MGHLEEEMNRFAEDQRRLERKIQAADIAWPHVRAVFHGWAEEDDTELHSIEEGHAALRENVNYLGLAVQAGDDEFATQEVVRLTAMGVRFLVELGLPEVREEMEPVQQGCCLQRNVMQEIYSERVRQILDEGFHQAHDDAHGTGSLAKAAACYAMPIRLSEAMPPIGWPFRPSWWKPKDRRRDLIRAAALLMAEIERMDRMEHKS
ncbi:MAG: hypothetical protein JJU06_05995 [Ectothiorhodospiraceae bacterium]|nr:hypothetical protein [Ectothiorhodospiraceae bacterium]